MEKDSEEESEDACSATYLSKIRQQSDDRRVALPRAKVLITMSVRAQCTLSDAQCVFSRFPVPSGHSRLHK